LDQPTKDNFWFIPHQLSNYAAISWLEQMICWCDYDVWNCTRQNAVWDCYRICSLIPRFTSLCFWTLMLYA